MIDYGVYIRYFRKIHIGSDSEINRGCEFYPSYQFRKTIISIGDRVYIGPNVVFFGAGQDRSARRNDLGDSIIVEDDVYIGGNSTIRYGVRIGKGATIGSNSCVVKDVKPGTLVLGQSAKPYLKG
jgi:maltose O-acetyltransferase